MKSAPNLLLEPHRSRIELALLIGVALLAIVATASSGLRPIVIAALVVVVVSVLAVSLRQGSRRSAPRCQLLVDGQWRIESSTLSDTARLVDARDLGFLIALRFESADRSRYALALWPDSIPADTRRRLRIWMGRTTRVDPPA